MEKSDFRVLVRRVPGYEPLVSLRFEMKEGYGELHVGERRRASPSAAGEAAEVSSEAVRGGRFVHVLSSGRRRQSYAFSRLDDDRLQRIPDTSWTELTPVTEFGIRYLDLPELGVAPSAAVVQVSSNPAPARTSTPAPSSESGLLARARSRASSASPGAAPRGSAQPAPPWASVSTSSATPATARVSTPDPTPRPEPTLRTSSGGAPPRIAVASTSTSASASASAPAASPGGAQVGSPPRGISVEAGLGRDAVARLSEAELRERLLREMAKVEAQHQTISELQRRLDDSLTREEDLVEVIRRWSERG